MVFRARKAHIDGGQLPMAVGVRMEENCSFWVNKFDCFPLKFSLSKFSEFRTSDPRRMSACRRVF